MTTTKKIHCFIEESDAFKPRIYFNVCSIVLGEQPIIITVHDICKTREEALNQLEQVKKGTHPTQTHPAGSLWLYTGDK